MTASTRTSSREPRTQPAPDGLLAPALVVGAVSCLAYVASILVLGHQSQREGTASLYAVVVNVAAALAFAAVSVTLPAVLNRIGVTRLVVVACTAAFVGLAFMAWDQATLVVHLTRYVTDAEYLETTVPQTLWPLPKMVFGLVGYVSLAVTGWRGRLIPRGAAALLAFAGLLSVFFPFPPGALLACLALLWITRQADQ